MIGGCAYNVCETGLDLKLVKRTDATALFNKHGITLIPAWISNYIHYNVWDEITYPSPNKHRR